jgi:hypothetical protein
MSEIVAAAGTGLTIEQFANSVSAYAAIHALPSSYGLLSSIFVAEPDLDLDQVIAKVTAEYRRREMKGETVNEHGLLASKTQEKFSGRTPKEGGMWCENHKSNSHNTVDCRNKVWLPLEEYRRKKEAEKKKERGYAAQAKEEDDEPKKEVAGKAGELALASQLDRGVIVIDSGATSPFIKDKELLTHLTPLEPPVSIQVGDGKVVKATHKGRLSFKRIYFDNSFYVPDMAYNLLSTQRLGPAQLGGEWQFSKLKGARLVDKHSNVLLQGSWTPAGLWITSESPVRSINTQIGLEAKEDLGQPTQDLLQWHRRLGHADMKKVWDLGKAGELDGKAWDGVFCRVECIGCLQGKTARVQSSVNNERAAKPLVNISIDLWGPASTKSRQGYYYFLTCYDDHTGYIHTSPIRSKDAALPALVEYINLVENQLDRTVKSIRSDQGGEFRSNAMKDWCTKKGIEHELVPTDAHNQNGRVERAHLTLMNDVRTMLIDSGLSKVFWVDALLCATYTRNRLPDSKGETPYTSFEADQQQPKVNYAHMQAFGAPCVYRVAK